VPSYETAPDWVRQMRLYLLFPKAASNQNSGILRDLIARGKSPGGLEYIRDMGFNTVWIMPVMKTDNDRIDNNIGIGYNIVDFYSVVSTYGTRQDFKDFVNEAHRLGLKVILDVTPNHTGRNHPWAVSARTLGRRSPHFAWYQRTIPTSGPATNTNGLGWGTDAAGFVCAAAPMLATTGNFTAASFEALTSRRKRLTRCTMNSSTAATIPDRTLTTCVSWKIKTKTALLFSIAQPIR
jgi:hypothetical protein